MKHKHKNTLTYVFQIQTNNNIENKTHITNIRNKEGTHNTQQHIIKHLYSASTQITNI